jgi:hypothetical protein
VRGVRQRGADVLTAKEAGLLSASDQQHLERARAEVRTLFTQDENFLALHGLGVTHAGIAYAPQGTSIGHIIRGLMLIYQVLDADDMKGHVEYL